MTYPHPLPPPPHHHHPNPPPAARAGKRATALKFPECVAGAVIKFCYLFFFLPRRTSPAATSRSSSLTAKCTKASMLCNVGSFFELRALTQRCRSPNSSLPSSLRTCTVPPRRAARRHRPRDRYRTKLDQRRQSSRKFHLKDAIAAPSVRPTRAIESSLRALRVPVVRCV